MRDLPERVPSGDVIGACPSCGAELRASIVGDPDNGGKPTRCLLHTMPFCHYFGVTSPDQIERDVRDGNRDVRRPE